MALDRDLLDAVRDLRRLLILTRAQLQASGVIGVDDHPDVNLRQKQVKCGKAGCTRCPHGPYWYAYWTENGTRRSRYVGRLLTDDSLS
jgi:hypothetical protein